MPHMLHLGLSEVPAPPMTRCAFLKSCGVAAGVMASGPLP
jgi:hypothetical protein